MADAREFVAVGGAMVDRYYDLSNLPEPDGGAFIRDERVGVGGIAGNLASTAARLGRETGLIARVGDDDRADRIERDLAQRDIDTTRVRRGDGESTHSLVLRANGERMVVTGGDSAAALALRDADRPYFQGAAVVAANAYLPERVTAPLVEMRETGALSLLSFDLSGPLSELVGRGTTPGTIDRALAAADLVLVGEVAMDAYLAHHDASDPVALLREQGVERGALTHGDDGATLLAPDGTIAIDAFGVDTVDTTGAGDAFHAALVDAWLLAERAPRAAGEFAAATAALNCTGDGARGGLPTREDVETLLAHRT